MKYRILIADDELDIRQMLRLYLEKEGYEVYEAVDGMEAFSVLESTEIDLLLLDIMMPKKNGYEVLKELRQKSNIPVIILSAKDTDDEKILGLDLGADDYIAKPFHPMEAMARINSNLRRFYALGAKAKSLPAIKVKDLTLDQEACVLYQGEMLIELTSVEYKIMQLFMENPGRVFTKKQIYEAGWGEEFAGGDNNLMVCMSKLRAKLSGDANAYIKTIRGLGYRLEKG